LINGLKRIRLLVTELAVVAAHRTVKLHNTFTVFVQTAEP
jgi:hypothetical protein